ncbi:hypothetical protein HUG10_08140 [Halorarum halophilum]|uniref:Uncharacterized protein n=1 Tax=Halorarum halophilum TaxID=2743090 RepID=A0A7D5L2R0_9EURY|nr:hypothetical protein [Halobaculum halophilum]QLG27523.1 hypothetical protein HUG10_08140 [Halobaculum halophilum]
MTVAEDAREAVRARPYLFDALRAGVVNYAAAAETLDIDAETDAVATALRRYAADLDPPSVAADARVTMHSGVVSAEDRDADDENAEDDALLGVGGARFAEDGGALTAVVARGDVDARALEAALGCLRTADVAVEAAGVADGEMVVVVGRRDGATAVRAVEAALAS